MRAAIRQILFAGNPFSPIQLFAAGEQGAWYDPSDQTTLFATHDGTTPGVAVGNPVGKILDKSGRGNHATQSTLAARPTLQIDENGNYFLLFDGIDDCLFTSAINFTATDKMTVWSALRKLSDATVGTVYEISANLGSNNGACSLLSSGVVTAGAKYGVALRGTLTAYGDSPASYPAPITNVLCETYNIGAASFEAEASLRINQTLVSITKLAGTTSGTGTFGNYPLFIGRRNNASQQFNGRVYFLIMRNAQSTETQITQTENWVNQRTRAY